MFKGLFDLQDEGIIKDFLKDDHHVQIRDSVRNVLKNDKIEKEITNNEDLLNAFKKYSNLEISDLLYASIAFRYSLYLRFTISLRASLLNGASSSYLVFCFIIT